MLLRDEASLAIATSGVASPNGVAYLTIEELAKKTRYSVSTLRRLCRKGLIPFFQPGGPRSRVVFPTDSIERIRAILPPSVASAPKTELLSLPDKTAADTARVQSGPRPRWESAFPDSKPRG
ncbi:MAG: helix-turn-helix domain-containing protein [Gemmataceae bacterium]